MEINKKSLEKILSKKRVGNSYQYLIKWKDQVKTKWVSIDNLFDHMEMISYFETSLRELNELNRILKVSSKRIKLRNKAHDIQLGSAIKGKYL